MGFKMTTELQKYLKAETAWLRKMKKTKGWAERLVLETKRPSPTKTLIELGILKKKNQDSI